MVVMMDYLYHLCGWWSFTVASMLLTRRFARAVIDGWMQKMAKNYQNDSHHTCTIAPRGITKSSTWKIAASFDFVAPPFTHLSHLLVAVSPLCAHTIFHNNEDYIISCIVPCIRLECGRICSRAKNVCAPIGGSSNGNRNWRQDRSARIL